MAHFSGAFYSECLKMNTSLTVILPEQRRLQEVKVVFLLHGLTDDGTAWGRYSSVERYAREHNAAVVMPEVQRSFYTDMELGVEYFSYVLEELPAVCRRFFGFSSKREYNYIMGLSMGGYGALKCTFHRPEQYAGCAAFSAVIDLPAKIAGAESQLQREFQAIFGAGLQVPEEGDLPRLAKKAEAASMPEIYLACGESDDLYPENVKFVKLLQERGIQPVFEHWEGSHSWSFWDRAVECAMNLLLREGI